MPNPDLPDYPPEDLLEALQAKERREKWTRDIKKCLAKAREELTPNGISSTTYTGFGLCDEIPEVPALTYVQFPGLSKEGCWDLIPAQWWIRFRGRN